MFKVGDKVGTIWGDGEVIIVFTAGKENPVKVSTSTRDIRCNHEGIIVDDFNQPKHPAVWHIETGSPHSGRKLQTKDIGLTFLTNLWMLLYRIISVSKCTD